jgi:hypothetical protein
MKKGVCGAGHKVWSPATSRKVAVPKYFLTKLRCQTIKTN